MHRWLARAIYYPTLSYNYFLGRTIKIRRWWDPINEHLLLGARPMRGDAQRLSHLGVTGVVNMCEEMPGPVGDYQLLGIEQLWLPTIDFHHPTQRDIEAGAEFIEMHRSRGGKVYVHCKAGRARSATVVLWWLVRYGELSPVEAQRSILQARPHSNPNIYLRPAIRQLYEELRNDPLRTSEELVLSDD